MAAAKEITPKEFAAIVESDARTVRKFLRSEGIRVGKGHRHAIRNTAALRKGFGEWVASRTPSTDAE
jgi:hypothetical protein